MNDPASAAEPGAPVLLDPAAPPTVVAAAWILLVLLILANAFFVACHHAVEKSRGAEIPEPEDGSGKKRLLLANRIAEEPERYLAVTRFGMIGTTLLVGALAVPLWGVPLDQWLQRIAVPDAVSHWLAGALAFLLALSTLVVFGELIPKSVAIRHPVPTVLRLGPALNFLRSLLVPFTLPHETVAHHILRRVLRVDPVREGEVVHTSEELQALVEDAGGNSDVTETEREIVINALELSDLKVRDIMVPRNEVVCLDADRPFAENLHTAIESRHTRLPIIRGHMDNTLGLIHIKDLLKLSGQKDPGLLGIRRELLPVPEKMPLDQLLQFFLREHAHLALVVDEFGGTLGVAFLDNVIEQLVGDIHDEFDEQNQEFHRVNDDEFFAEGAVGLHELADFADIEIEHPDVSTLGGLITNKLGHLPRSGEFIEEEGYRFTVTKTGNNRVLQVHARRLPDPDDGESEDRPAPPTP